MFIKLTRFLALVTGLLCAGSGIAQAATATMRVDYYHTGNSLSETYSLHQVVIEPLPWPGNPNQAIDKTNRGYFLLQIENPISGKIIFSRGFSSIFQEWQTTAEATATNKTFHESVRFPKPDKPVRLRILKRDDRNVFSSAWSAMIDPDDLLVVRAHPPKPAPLLEIQNSGNPSDKVDLLFIGDGYTESERKKFEADAKRLSEHLFSYPPFKQRRGDFNVWGLMQATQESGINRPSNKTYRHSAMGTTYDAFRSERYVLAFDNLGFRNIAQYAPYEFVVILTNSDTYGGGGIFGLYSTAAAGSDWAGYLVVHELGHHFAALADEYYTSDVAYVSGAERPEPWEPNVSALLNPAKLKWKGVVKQDTALPTPWPKQEFEAYQKQYQAKRKQLRADNRPESEMNTLFDQERSFTANLFSAAPQTNSVIGAFEGANYQANGYYRSQMNCIMFTRDAQFCNVCSDAIEDIIDLYSR